MVDDAGLSVPSEAMSLFARFQVGSSRLGLAIAAWVVRARGASFTVRYLQHSRCQSPATLCS
ncbi:hypothetical protein [Catenulispora rubra]|uniref:hypothetical protein n=1 Tax=Catenulispora rubra TaxID=280293 RepID=UPI0018925592|nr:hypothetical protein [Catenulispora rubra]